jgi:S-adenosylmethionine synthetase
VLTLTKKKNRNSADLLAAEYVMEGHPDKVCDLVADAILDQFITCDIDARVGCEVMVAKETVFVGGEFTSRVDVSIDSTIRETLSDIGYDSSESGISPHECQIHRSISPQSSFLSKIVTQTDGTFIPASDQAVIVGFAVRNDFGMVPPASYIAKRIALECAKRRHDGHLDLLWPDGKALVVLDGDMRTVSNAEAILVSNQHMPSANVEILGEQISRVVLEILAEHGLGKPSALEINPPSGSFYYGGPAADTGVTGRKVVADTYGPSVPCGGGSLSGKDPSKIDRCGAYGARWVAKSLVASGLLDAVQVTLTYVIGTPKPAAISILCPTTPKHRGNNKAIADLVRKKFDLRPGAIIEQLDLRRPIYYEATRSGHFGINEDLPWEQARTDL